ncbi:MAG: outer membrane beta-barrel protein [Chthoniobacterales bacterium]
MISPFGLLPLSALALLYAFGSLQAEENLDAEPAAETATEANQSAEVVTPNLGTGNFTRSPFRVSISVREGYDDNVYTMQSSPIGSFYTNGNVAVDYKFGNARTQVALEAFGGLSYYYNRPFGRGYDISTGLSLSISHQATPRLGLGAAIYLAYQSEPDFNTGFGINRRSGNYFYTSDKFSTSYQWAPRFSTVTSYTLGALNYEDSSVGLFEDRVEHTFGNEFRFLVLPTTTAVGEYRYQIIDYDMAPRDSTTHFVLAGLDHSFNPRFNVSLRGGAQFRMFEDIDGRTSPYGEATLNYALTEKASLSWNNRYGLDEPEVPGSPSRTSFRTGLRGNYAFSPRFSSTLSIYYQHDENDGFVTPFVFVPPFSEDSLDLSAGVRYEINSTFAALAGYSHTEILSDITLREYARNRYYLGLNATF